MKTKINEDIITDEIVISAIEPENNRKKVWFQEGKNLFDKNDILEGYFINTDGNPYANDAVFLVILSKLLEIIPYLKLEQVGTQFYESSVSNAGKVKIGRTTSATNGTFIINVVAIGRWK